MNSLQDFMISKVRVKMVELFFTSQSDMYYVREITREIKEEINAVRRELDRMLTAGLLKSEQRGNRLYYSLNPKYLYFQELQQMVSKTTGLGEKIRKARRKLGTVNFVMFSARFIKGLPTRQNDLDLLVVGNIVLPELELLVKVEEKRLEREINYAVFSEEEFKFRKTRRDPFIMDVLYGSRVMVIGSEEEFVEKNLPGL
jgi:DNA-binding transcriptional ArsR family regulator